MPQTKTYLSLMGNDKILRPYGMLLNWIMPLKRLQIGLGRSLASSHSTVMIVICENILHHFVKSPDRWRIQE